MNLRVIAVKCNPDRKAKQRIKQFGSMTSSCEGCPGNVSYAVAFNTHQSMGCNTGKHQVRVDCVLRLPTPSLREHTQPPSTQHQHKSKPRSFTAERAQVNIAKARFAPQLQPVQASSLLTRRYSVPHTSSPLDSSAVNAS